MEHVLLVPAHQVPVLLVRVPQVFDHPVYDLRLFRPVRLLQRQRSVRPLNCLLELLRHAPVALVQVALVQVVPALVVPALVVPVLVVHLLLVLHLLVHQALALPVCVPRVVPSPVASLLASSKRDTSLCTTWTRITDG